MLARIDIPIAQPICTETGICIRRMARWPTVEVLPMRGVAADRSATAAGRRAAAKTSANARMS